VEHAAIKVHILPLEPKKLAFPHSGVDGQHVQSFEPVSARRFKQSFSLLPVQGSYLFSLDFRGLDSVADIPGDQTVQHCLLQCLAEYAVHLTDRGAG